MLGGVVANAFPSRRGESSGSDPLGLQHPADQWRYFDAPRTPPHPSQFDSRFLSPPSSGQVVAIICNNFGYGVNISVLCRNTKIATAPECPHLIRLDGIPVRLRRITALETKKRLVPREDCGRGSRVSLWALTRQAPGRTCTEIMRTRGRAPLRCVCAYALHIDGMPSFP